MAEIIKETESQVGEISGKKKILLVSHSMTLEAFASSGVDTSSSMAYLNSLYFENARMVPFKVNREVSSNNTTFQYKR